MDTTTLINIPSFVYLGIIGVLGGIGNSLILIVYSRKKKKSATTVFIQFLAVVDLVTNIVLIPATVYVRLYSNDFSHAHLCKAYVFGNMTMTVVPMFTILAIAVTRYRKICVTFGWQVSTRQAKFTCAVTVVGACLLVTPYITVRSIRPSSAGRNGTNVTVCFLDDNNDVGLWPALTHGMILLAFVVCSLSLTFFYSRIGLKAWRHRFLHGVRSLSKRRSVTNKQNIADTGYVDDTSINKQTTNRGSDNKTDDIEDSTEISVTSDNGFSNNSTIGTDARHITELNSSFGANLKSGIRKESATRLKPSKPKRPFCGRITRMLISISTVYILSYLTSITLSIVRAAVPEVVSSMDPGSKAVYSLFLLSYLINSGVNPMFYSFYDRNFRRETKIMFKSFVGRKSGCL